MIPNPARSPWAARTVTLVSRHPPGCVALDRRASRGTPSGPQPVSPVLIERLTQLREAGYDHLAWSWRPHEDHHRLHRFARHLGYRVSIRIDDSPDALPQNAEELVFEMTPRRNYSAEMALLRRSGRRLGLGYTIDPGGPTGTEVTWLVPLAIKSGASFLVLRPDPEGLWTPERLDAAGQAVDALQQGCALPIVSFFTRTTEVLDHAGPWQALAQATADTPEKPSDVVPQVAVDVRGAVWPLSARMHPSQCMGSGSARQFEQDIAWYTKSRAGPLRKVVQAFLSTLAAKQGTHVDLAAGLVALSARPKAQLTRAVA